MGPPKDFYGAPTGFSIEFLWEPHGDPSGAPIWTPRYSCGAPAGLPCGLIGAPRVSRWALIKAPQESPWGFHIGCVGAP